MKTNSASVTGRVAIGALFAIVSFYLALAALWPTYSESAQRKKSNFQNTRQTAQVAAAIPSTIPPAPQPATPDYIGFENFEPPASLVQVFSSSQGSTPHTVEYMLN